MLLEKKMFFLARECHNTAINAYKNVILQMFTELSGRIIGAEGIGRYKGKPSWRPQPAASPDSHLEGDDVEDEEHLAGCPGDDTNFAHSSFSIKSIAAGQRG